LFAHHSPSVRCLSLGKANQAVPYQDHRRGAQLPYVGRWARRWADHWVRDAWPVRRQTYGYLPSLGASPPFDRYQIILLGEQRHTRVNNLPKVVPTRSQPATLGLQFRHVIVTLPNHSLGPGGCQIQMLLTCIQAEQAVLDSVVRQRRTSILQQQQQQSSATPPHILVSEASSYDLTDSLRVPGGGGSRRCSSASGPILMSVSLLSTSSVTTRESSRSLQVPPPRQSYSPGGVTVFALPAVRLCPL